MEPVEWVMLIIAIIGAATAAYGTYESGQQAKKQADYQEDVANREAQYQKQLAEKEAADFKRKQRLLTSSQISNMASSGLTLQSFEPVLEYEAGEAEMDYLTILQGGDVNAAKQKQDAKLYAMKGRSASRTGTISAGSSLLAGAGNAYKTYST
jgi:hypothetical protein